MSRRWTEGELHVALGLYCKLPFGQFHAGHPLIIRAAKALDRTPSSVAMKLSNLASLDPVITGSGRVGLKGASDLDRKVWDAFSADTKSWMPEIESRLNGLLDAKVRTDPLEHSISDISPDYTGEEQLVETRQRRGQGLFREAVLSAYQSRCCVTDISDARLLVASHIKPWAIDQANRLNPHNGLCLSALIDRAFDQGLVTVSADFRLVISSELESQRGNSYAEEAFWAREGKQISLPEKFFPGDEFLQWHREVRFQGCR